MASFSVFSVPQWQKKDIPCKGISFKSVPRNIATETLKKLKRAFLMASFSDFSVPQWQKKDIPCKGIAFKSVPRNIATETLKKTEKSFFNGFLLCFLCASVAKKRYTLQGDFTTAYISNQYLLWS